MIKLTKHQQEILDYLRKGGKLKTSFNGWVYKGKAIRRETESAILATGEVEEVSIAGRYRETRVVVHKPLREKCKECGSEELSLPTSADWECVCAECGAVQ